MENIIAVRWLFVSICMVIASGLLLATLITARELKRVTSNVARTSTMALLILCYLISPVVFDEALLFWFRRKDVGYVAIDPAWWMTLAPAALALVAVMIFARLHQRRFRSRAGHDDGVNEDGLHGCGEK
jgi:cytochrome bd-type quinol oxidase subunit 2